MNCRQPGLVRMCSIALTLVLAIAVGCASQGTRPTATTSGEQVMSPYGMYSPGEKSPVSRDCFCSTDPTGKTFCGVRGSCADKACKKNGDCRQDQLCLVDNCCPGAQGKGLCVDRCPGECLAKGPFSCPNFPTCDQL
ncbi:MAG: hypothetical protein KDD47_21675 [Acidobacteria bacterium]|nr:hypothetical protein [Acidobacteriota bacterium]